MSLEYIKRSELWAHSRFRWDDLERHIVQIDFVAHTNPGDQGSEGYSPTNHWTLHFVHTDSTNFDMVPTFGSDGAGVVIIDSHDGPDVKEAHICIISCPINPLKGAVTLSDVLGLVVELKRDHFKFSEVGEGCRFWCKTFARDLANAELITKEKEEEVAVAVGLYWKSAGGTEPREIAEGTFC